MIDIEKIRADFPILNQMIYHKPLVYFDNAATTQKPKQVLDAVTKFYSESNSNIHRAVHHLSDKATRAYEHARETVKNFINATKTNEIIFTRGATEAINLVAFSFGEKYINQGDEILISEMEHHSNIVPWQMLCARKKAILKVVPFDDNGELQMLEFEKNLNNKTKIVSITYISNSMGTINPIKEIIDKAHLLNIPVFVDAAQAAQHKKIDVQELDCDFLAFSGHKIYAETGIGVLFGKEKWLEDIPPYQGGGDMIKTVSFEKTTFADLPLKFEAGTSNFAGAVSLAAALEYINNIGIEKIADYENSLLIYANEQLKQIEKIKIIGTAKNKCSLISFNMDGIHHFDIGMILDKMGIAVRTGTHCTEPVMKHFGITGTTRASFAFYNTKEEIDQLIAGLVKVKKMFS